MPIISVGNGLFMDTDPVDLSEVYLVDPKIWKPGTASGERKLPAGYELYPFVEFRSLERAYYGVALSKRKPSKKSRPGAFGAVDHVMTWSEPIAPLLDYGDAVKEYSNERRHRSIFEQFPYVELETREQFRDLVRAADLVGDPKTWSPTTKKPSTVSGWKGPGIYDMREEPPKYESTVEEYEESEMLREAEEVLDFMFQGDEWNEVARKLIEESFA